MATRDVTSDASNPDKTTPTIADKAMIIDVSTTPDSLKEATLDNLFKVITGLTEDTAPAVSSDWLVTYDTSASAAKKVLPSTLIYTSGNGARGDIRNYKLSVTVASNNLTVAVKTLAGSDPSSTDPIRVRIGNTERQITSALSVTANAGTNWCNSGGSELATKEVDYFVYIGYNATDGVVIGFSRINHARQYSDFSATSTNEKYCKISNITTAASTDYYENVGRFAATLSAGAGYTWTVPTFTAINLIERPIYETRVLSWTPTYRAGGSMTYTSVTTTIAEYKLIFDRLCPELVSTGTTGGTASANIRATLPFNVRNYAANIPMAGGTADGGGSLGAFVFMDATTANLLTCRRYDGANYGLGTGRIIYASGTLSI